MGGSHAEGGSRHVGPEDLLFWIHFLHTGCFALTHGGLFSVLAQELVQKGIAPLWATYMGKGDAHPLSPEEEQAVAYLPAGYCCSHSSHSGLGCPFPTLLVYNFKFTHSCFPYVFPPQRNMYGCQGKTPVLIVFLLREIILQCCTYKGCVLFPFGDCLSPLIRFLWNLPTKC